MFVTEYCRDFNSTRAAIKAGYRKRSAKVTAAETLTKPNVQAAIQTRLRPRLLKLGLALDNTLEECGRLAYARPGPLFEDADGELRLVSEWPLESRQTVVQMLSLKRQALKDVLEYLRHAGIYGQPEPASNLTVNNVTIVPVERLTNEPLKFYLQLAEQGQALPPVAKDALPGEALPGETVPA